MNDDLDVDKLEAQLAALANGPEDAKERIDTLLQLAWAIGVADTSRCRALTEEAKNLAQRTAYDRGLTYAKRNLAYTSGLEGKARTSLRLAQEAERELAELGELAGEASTLDIQFHGYERLGDYASALSLAERCLKINRTIGHRRQEAWAHHNIGWIYAETDDRERAQHRYEEALEIFKEIDYTAGEGRVLDRMAQLLRTGGDLEGAFNCQKAAQEIFEKIELHLGIAMGNAELGRLCQLMGRLDEAQAYFKKSVDHFDLTPNRPAIAHAITLLARLQIETRQYAAAHTSLERALETLEDLEAYRFEFPVHEALSALYEAEGNLTKALMHSREHLRLKTEAHHLERRDEINRMKLRMDIERAEKDAEIHRLKYVELEQMQAQLVDTEKKALLGSLAAGLAHEINNPIGVVKSNVDVARRAVERLDDVLSPTEKRGRRALTALRATLDPTLTAAERIQTLTQSLKRFARLDEAQVQDADLVEGIESALTLFTPQLPDRIRITSSLEPLPRLRCRPADLNRVFMTLLVNASEAIEDAGEIRIKTHTENDTIFVTVSDDGCGMAPEKLKTLFDVGFSREGQRVRFHAGLATASNTVEQHGGRITVESELEKGTTFRISLPVQRP